MNRILYLDYVKAFGILSIMLAHCAVWFPELRGLTYVVCSYHVPIFFIVSGLLFAHFPEKYEINFSDFIRKRFRALIIPYIWFSVFNSFLKLSVLFATHKLTGDLLHSEMIQLFITGNGAVWFLLTLFFAELMFFAIRKITIQYNTILLLTGILSCSICFIVGQSNNPFIILFLRIFGAYFIIVSGYLLFGLFRKMQHTGIKCVFGGSSIIIWVALLFVFKYRYSFFEGKFETPLISIPIMLLSCFGFVCLLMTIKKQLKHFEWIGKNSLGFLLVHQPIILVLIYSQKDRITTFSATNQLIIALLLYVVVVLLCIPSIWLIKNKLPFLIGQKKKIDIR